MTEVTDDMKVIKKILKEGEGYERPNEGAVVQGWCYEKINFGFPQYNILKICYLYIFLLAVKLIGKLQDGTVFLKKGHNEGEELFEFKTDEGNRSLLSTTLLTPVSCFS